LSNDLGRFDETGNLVLVGRSTEMYIRGGYNVYPLEVEHVLAEHPGVREAAVVGVPDERWGEVVKAFVVAADPELPPIPEELRAHTRAQLAGFKVPTEWAFVPELPRNPAGKILRRRLLDSD